LVRQQILADEAKTSWQPPGNHLATYLTVLLTRGWQLTGIVMARRKQSKQEIAEENQRTNSMGLFVAA